MKNFAFDQTPDLMILTTRSEVIALLGERHSARWSLQTKSSPFDRFVQKSQTNLMTMQRVNQTSFEQIEDLQGGVTRAS